MAYRNSAQGPLFYLFYRNRVQKVFFIDSEDVEYKYYARSIFQLLLALALRHVTVIWTLALIEPADVFVEEVEEVFLFERRRLWLLVSGQVRE